MNEKIYLDTLEFHALICAAFGCERRKNVVERMGNGREWQIKNNDAN